MARRIRRLSVGRQLLAITTGLFGHEEEAVEVLRAVQAREIGALRIGSVRPLDAMGICAGVVAQHPNLKLSVTLSSADEVLDGLLTFAFGHRRSKDQ